MEVRAAAAGCSRPARSAQPTLHAVATASAAAAATCHSCWGLGRTRRESWYQSGHAHAQHATASTAAAAVAPSAAHCEQARAAACAAACCTVRKGPCPSVWRGSSHHSSHGPAPRRAPATQALASWQALQHQMQQLMTPAASRRCCCTAALLLHGTKLRQSRCRCTHGVCVWMLLHFAAACLALAIVFRRLPMRKRAQTRA